MSDDMIAGVAVGVCLCTIVWVALGTWQMYRQDKEEAAQRWLRMAALPPVSDEPSSPDVEVEERFNPATADRFRLPLNPPTQPDVEVVPQQTSVRLPSVHDGADWRTCKHCVELARRKKEAAQQQEGKASLC
jgi:hypothetical protein